MKKNSFYVVLCLSIFSVCNAQSDFKKEWEAKSSLSPTFRTYNHDLSLVLVGDTKDLEMLDGKTGKVLWNFNAKKSLDVKSMVKWLMFENEEGALVQVIYKKQKADSAASAFLNPRTGQLIGTVTEAMLKPANIKPLKVSSKAFYGASYVDELTNTALELTYEYKSKLLNSMGGGGSAIGGGTAVNMTVKATGGNNWTTVFTTKALRHLCEELLPYGEPDMMMKVFTSEGKVFVVSENITVLDLATGKQLWETTFDNVTATMGLSATQEIGRSAFPVAYKDAAFVCDLSKGENVIKKVNLSTGSLIWKTEKLNGNDIVNNMVVVGNSLIVKFGGIIRKEKYVPNGQGGSTSTAKYEYEGDSDIRAYDITTGKLLWNSDKFAKNDKFQKSSCNMLMEDGKIYVCGQSDFLIINATNGEVISKSDYGSKQIGGAVFIFPDNENIIIEGKEGVASFSKSGKKNFSVSTDKNVFSQFEGNAYIVWTGKTEMELIDFVRVDLDNGTILGKMKDCRSPKFDSTGDYFLQFAGNKVTKYKTNK